MSSNVPDVTKRDLAVQIAGAGWQVYSYGYRYVQFSRAGVTIAAEFLSRQRGSGSVGDLLKATLHVWSSRVDFDGRRGRRVEATDNAHELLAWLGEPLPATGPVVWPLEPTPPLTGVTPKTQAPSVPLPAKDRSRGS